VDAVAHPDDDGGFGEIGWFFGGGDAGDVGLAEGFEDGVIFGGGDGEVDEGAAERVRRRRRRVRMGEFRISDCGLRIADFGEWRVESGEWMGR
jgi:hypothetical protein